MTDLLQEQLSACLDGELSEAELDLLIKRVEREAGLGATLGRYALIGEALKADVPAAASSTFAANVMAALAEEPAAARRVPTLSPAVVRRLRPVAGFAIAAGVAAVAVISVQRVGLDSTQQVATTATPANIVVSAPTEDPSYVVPTNTTTTALVPATRLTNYVVAHSEYSSQLGRRSVLSGVLAEDDVDDEAQPANDQAADDPKTDDSTSVGAAQER